MLQNSAQNQDSLWKKNVMRDPLVHQFCLTLQKVYFWVQLAFSCYAGLQQDSAPRSFPVSLTSLNLNNYSIKSDVCKHKNPNFPSVTYSKQFNFTVSTYTHKLKTPAPFNRHRLTGASIFLPLILAKMTEETKEDKRVFSFQRAKWKKCL